MTPLQQIKEVAQQLKRIRQAAAKLDWSKEDKPDYKVVREYVDEGKSASVDALEGTIR